MKAETRPLIKLQDGEIYNISDDQWTEEEGYCSTCWSSYIAGDLTFYTTHGRYVYEFSRNDSVNGGTLFQIIIPNIHQIEEMTMNSFIEWFSDQLKLKGVRFTFSHKNK